MSVRSWEAPGGWIWWSDLDRLCMKPKGKGCGLSGCHSSWVLCLPAEGTFSAVESLPSDRGCRNAARGHRGHPCDVPAETDPLWPRTCGSHKALSLLLTPGTRPSSQ